MRNKVMFCAVALSVVTSLPFGSLATIDFSVSVGPPDGVIYLHAAEPSENISHPSMLKYGYRDVVAELAGIITSNTTDGATNTIVQIRQVPKGGIDVLEFVGTNSIAYLAGKKKTKLSLRKLNDQEEPTSGSPRYYDLYQAGIFQARFGADPSKADYQATVAFSKKNGGQMRRMPEGGIRVIRTETNTLRQVLGQTCFVDVVILRPECYEIRFYDRDKAGVRNPKSGLYEPQGEPFGVKRVEERDDDPAAHTRLLITSTGKEGVKSYEYTYVEENHEWTLVKGDGSERIEKSVHWDDKGEVKKSQWITRSQGREHIRIEVERKFPFGMRAIEKASGYPADGPIASTRYMYYDIEGESHYGSVKRTEYPDGRWIAYNYPAEGHRETVEGDKDGEKNRTIYLYDKRTGGGTNDSAHSLSTTIKIINGVTNSVEYKTGYEKKDGEKVSIIEQCGTHVFPFGDKRNLRQTTTTYGRKFPAGASRGDVKEKVDSDGKTTVYAYDTGFFKFNSDTPSASTFTPDPKGDYFRKIVTHTMDKRITREVGISNSRRANVMTENYESTGGEPEKRTFWNVFEYNDRGDRIRTHEPKYDMLDALGFDKADWGQP